MRLRRLPTPTGPTLSDAAILYMLTGRLSTPPTTAASRPRDEFALFVGREPAVAACWTANERFLLKEAKRLGIAPQVYRFPGFEQTCFYGQYATAYTAWRSQARDDDSA